MPSNVSRTSRRFFRVDQQIYSRLCRSLQKELTGKNAQIDALRTELDEVKAKNDVSTSFRSRERETST